MTAPDWVHGFGGGMPVVERTRNANRGGGQMSELKVNRHQFRDRARRIVMVMVVFHVQRFIRIGALDFENVFLFASS